MKLIIKKKNDNVLKYNCKFFSLLPNKIIIGIGDKQEVSIYIAKDDIIFKGKKRIYKNYEERNTI